MPPQQSHGLLDVFDKGFGFGAHERLYGVRIGNRRSPYLDRQARSLRLIADRGKAGVKWTVHDLDTLQRGNGGYARAQIMRSMR
jgi:hypothetical protein